MKSGTQSRKPKNRHTSARPSGGALFVVATPIGNSLDISQRALEILKQCDVVAAEDTRVARRQLNQWKVTKPKILSYRDENEKTLSAKIAEQISEGLKVALISDAGAPGISDPGFHLVRMCFEQGLDVWTIPGPSSLTAALSISPIGGGDFYFGGFLPSKKSGRRSRMEEAASLAVDRIVFFEAPHRLVEHLEDALEIFGDRDLFVARELTKPYEEKIFGPTSAALRIFQEKEPRGEFVLIYGPALRSVGAETEVSSEIQARLDAGETASQIVKELQKVSTLTRNELYNEVIRIKDKKN